MRVLHFGDNGPLSKENVQQIGKVDILLLPLDSKGHILDMNQAAEIRQTLQPKIVIPMHYGIPELERGMDRPIGLGPIDPCLANEKHVTRLERSYETFAADSLPDVEQILVFKHSPKVSMLGP